MRPDERNQFAESWLDATLAHYSGAEPRSGFEKRILANLPGAAPRRRPLWQSPGLIAFACTAITVLAIGLALLRRPGMPPTVVGAQAAPQAAVMSPAPATTPQPVSSIRTARMVRRLTRPSVPPGKEPRKPRFPASMPLSGQQSMVMAYISSTPVEELMKISAEQREWQESVENGAKGTKAQYALPGPDINHLQYSPLERGSRQPGEAR